MNKPATQPGMAEETLSFSFEGREIAYTFRPANRSDRPLVVLLHGHSRTPRPLKFRSPDWNILCPVDNFGLNGFGSWYLGERGDHFWLRAMPELIRSIHNRPDVYFLGSSMGGYGAILHGIRCEAKAVYANIPQTVLLGSQYAQQGMRRYFEALFAETGTSEFNDLKNLVRPGLRTMFLLSGHRYDKEGYLDEQMLPFVRALLDSNVGFGLEILPREGHRLAIPIPEAVRRFEVYEQEISQHFMGEPVTSAPEPVTMDASLSSVVAPARIAAPSSAEVLARDILLRPEAHWPASKSHMVPRFEKFLDRFQERTGIADRKALADVVTGIARERQADRPLTVFIMSPGGSGSHWLQDVLTLAAGTNPCGEVYVPPTVDAELRTLDADGRGLLLDCMHIAHSWQPQNDLTRAKFVNTAHNAGWGLSAAMPGRKQAILLARDPLDVVVSRTFRKQKFRNAYFADQSDLEYLRHNITYVKKFYRSYDSAPRLTVVRYEDMKVDLGPVLDRLRREVDLGITDEGLVKAVEAYQTAGVRTKGNFNRKPLPPIPPELLDLARSELAELRQRLGYL